MALALHFDVLNYVEKAEKLGVPNAVAKFQAREMESLYASTVEEVKKEIKNELLNNKDFATKGDVRESELRLQKEIKEIQKEIGNIWKEIEVVRKEIVQSKNQVIIWVGGMLISSGLLQHFFK